MCFVITVVGDEPPVHLAQEHRVLMSELTRYDGRGEPVPETPDCVGVPPVVERRVGQAQPLRRLAVVVPDGISADREQNGVGEEILDMTGEYLPRPSFGPLHYTVPPEVLAPTGTDGPRAQINVTARHAVDGLQLHTRGGHEGDRGPVGHLDGKDESFRVLPLQPRHARGVLLPLLNVADRVVVQNLPLDEPAGEAAKGCAVPVLGGVANGQTVQKGGDPLARELRGRERPVNQASNVEQVSFVCAPLSDKRKEIGVFLRDYQEFVQSAGGVVVKSPDQWDTPRDDFERELFFRGLVNEPASKLLDLDGGIAVAGSAGEASVPDAGHPDSTGPGLVGHGEILAFGKRFRHTTQHTELKVVRGALYGHTRKSLSCNVPGPRIELGCPKGRGILSFAGRSPESVSHGETPRRYAPESDKNGRPTSTQPSTHGGAA